MNEINPLQWSRSIDVGKAKCKDGYPASIKLACFFAEIFAQHIPVLVGINRPAFRNWQCDPILVVDQNARKVDEFFYGSQLQLFQCADKRKKVIVESIG